MSLWVERRLAPALAVSVVLVMVAATVANLLMGQDLAAAGHPELADSAGTTLTFGMTILIAGAVGFALSVRRPRNPVGWCFLALASTTGVLGLAETYAVNVVKVHPGGGPLGPQLAILADAMWLPWFGLIAAILHLTPTGRPVSRAWGWALTATVVVIGAGFLLKLLLEPKDLQAPLDGIATNPWAWTAATPMIGPLDRILVWSSGLGPVIGAASLLVRYRRSSGDERQQLKWLALSVVPLPLLIVVSYVATITDQDVVLNVATIGWLIVIPVSVWLSISRFRLYDVDRVLSRAVSWALLSMVLAGIYLGVVLLTTTALHGVTGGSQLAAGLAGVCAAGLATPLHRRSQRAVDRRFNRRRYETLRMVKHFVDEAPSGAPVDDVLRDALGDPGLMVTYAVQEPDASVRWVDATGHDAAGPADEPEPSRAQVDVRRGDTVVARVSFEPGRVDQSLVQAAVELASGELENVALRSAVALQLEQVRQSRSRIVQAQHAERSRIERDLHDGAQQRLLAVAFDLGAARLRLRHLPGTQDVQDQLAASVESLQVAVAELRGLANGLLPAALSGTGLSGALSELAGRTPVPLTVRNATGERRFAEPVEATAWFIALESVTNAVKHAGSSTIAIAVRARRGRLVVEIEDDGRGGADPGGQGLRGLADRAEAIGGSLVVRARSPRGTLVRAELPCES